MRQVVANIQVRLLIGAINASDAVHYATYHSAVPQGKGWIIENIAVNPSNESQSLQSALLLTGLEGINGDTLYLVQLTMSRYVELPDVPTFNRGVAQQPGVQVAGDGEVSRSGDSNPEFGDAPIEA